MSRAVGRFRLRQIEPGDGRVPIGHDRKAGADAGQLVADLHRGAALGPLVPHRGRQSGQPRLRRGIEASPGGKQGVDAQRGQLVVLDDHQRHAVRELAAVDRRQVERGLGGGLGERGAVGVFRRRRRGLDHQWLLALGQLDPPGLGCDARVGRDRGLVPGVTSSVMHEPLRYFLATRCTPAGSTLRYRSKSLLR